MSGKKKLYSKPRTTIYQTPPHNTLMAFSIGTEEDDIIDIEMGGTMEEGQGGDVKQQLFPWDEE